jgi:hypothetical protein
VANPRGFFPGSTGDRAEATPGIFTPTGRVDLPMLPGLSYHVTSGINDDATVIVGNANDPATRASQALIWRCP